MSARVLVASVALFAAGCPGDFKVESQTFPCRAASDCVEGYECHPTRYICVPRGSTDGGSIGAMDAGLSSPADAGFGSADAGRSMSRLIGAPCDKVTAPCDQGMCVDGFCCESACTGECHRCDIIPGSCTPAPEGTDPDNECTHEYSCADYTYGMTTGSCYAGAAMTVVEGTCSATGACRPRGCRNAGMGLEISKCSNAECFATNACPYGDPITRWDEPAELCKSGPSATCTLVQGMGCCSLLGACCPAPSCAPDGTTMCQ